MGQPGYIYFLHAIGTNRVKIGKTVDISRRLRELQRQQHPFPHRLLRTELVEDIDAADRAYKKQYGAYCVYKEWYELPEEFMAEFPEPIAAQEYNPMGHLGRKHRQPKFKANKVIGNLEQLRAILRSEGHEGAEANPHRAMAYYQRNMLRLMMEYDDQSRDFLVGDCKWRALELDEMIRLGRVIQITRHDQLVCSINPAFIPQKWYTADWIEEFITLIADPKTYNKAITQQQRDVFLFQAQRKFKRQIG